MELNGALYILLEHLLEFLYYIYINAWLVQLLGLYYLAPFLSCFWICHWISSSGRTTMGLLALQRLMSLQRDRQRHQRRTRALSKPLPSTPWHVTLCGCFFQFTAKKNNFLPVVLANCFILECVSYLLYPLIGNSINICISK